MRSCGIAVFILGLFATVSLIVGFATQYWFQYGFPGGLVNLGHTGLWRGYCPYETIGFRCWFSYGHAFWRAVKGLMIVALIGSIIGTLSSIGWISKSDDRANEQKKSANSVIFWYIVAGITGITGITVYPSYMHANRYNFSEFVWDAKHNIGYSYWCCMAASIVLFFIGTITSCSTKKWRKNTHSTQSTPASTTVVTGTTVVNSWAPPAYSGYVPAQPPTMTSGPGLASQGPPPPPPISTSLYNTTTHYHQTPNPEPPPPSYDELFRGKDNLAYNNHM